LQSICEPFRSQDTKSRLVVNLSYSLQMSDVDCGSLLSEVSRSSSFGTLLFQIFCLGDLHAAYSGSPFRLIIQLGKHSSRKLIVAL
jgi:hypothetical protein